MCPSTHSRLDPHHVSCLCVTADSVTGALVMQWQVWTAFGIMLGNIMGVAFFSLPDDVAWRYMLGSSFVPPLFVMVLVYFCPESPRWLLQNGKVDKAYRSFRRIRSSELEACRDLFYTYVGVELERKVNKGKNFFTLLYELFSIPRNARATMASWIIMFGQQFCGVNVIAYVSVFTLNYFENAIADELGPSTR